MARPEITGCQYFPLDCNFYEDRKVRLLRSEFGAKAETVLIRLWCMIYADSGWYAALTEDDVLLLAESMGPGFGADYIREVVQGSCKRGIFDGAVFAQFHILTSQAIQKRYLAIKCKKKTISVTKEYWLLDKTFFEGENEQLLLKLRFFSASGERTAVITEETPVNAEVTTQRKEKKTKAKQTKKTADKTAVSVGDPDTILRDFAGADTQLRGMLMDFKADRAERGEKITSRSCVLLCNRLTKLTDEAQVMDRSGYMCALLRTAIERKWKTVFTADLFKDRAPIHRPTAQGADRPRVVDADTDPMDLL